MGMARSVHAAQERWDGAVVALKLALRKAPSTATALQLLLAFRQAGRPADARQFAQQRMVRHPNDIAMWQLLAQPQTVGAPR